MHRDESTALELAKTDPRKALAMLEQSRKNLESSGLEPGIRDRLLRQLDRTLAQLSKEVDDNKPLLDLKEKNERVREEVDQRQQTKQANRQKLAEMINDFNRLMEEQRYEEAEMVAKRCKELDPNNPVVMQVVLQAKFAHRVAMNREIQDQKEQGVIDALVDVDRASIPFNTKEPYLFPGREKLGQADRQPQAVRRQPPPPLRAGSGNRAETEDARLAPVRERPAGQGRGLPGQAGAGERAPRSAGAGRRRRHHRYPGDHQAGARDFLKSALNLILQPLHLNYVIKDEVLKITSEQMRDGELVYRDLQRGRPGDSHPELHRQPQHGHSGGLYKSRGRHHRTNFNPMGIVRRAAVGRLQRAPQRSRATAASWHNPRAGEDRPPSRAIGGSNACRRVVGPGGLGGGAQADFDALIDLITSTIKPTTWDSVGGPGSIAPFETNLSIVVSQTQDVHEEIVDLLEQLRSCKTSR